MSYDIEIYRTSSGKQPFSKWFDGLKDDKIRALILGKLDRIKIGNLGDTKSVGGGVSELRIHLSPGYRIYYTKIGMKIILLLCGGVKGTQVRDIEEAKQFLLDFKAKEKSNDKNKTNQKK